MRSGRHCIFKDAHQQTAFSCYRHRKPWGKLTKSSLLIFLPAPVAVILHSSKDRTALHAAHRRHASIIILDAVTASDYLATLRGTGDPLVSSPCVAAVKYGENCGRSRRLSISSGGRSVFRPSIPCTGTTCCIRFLFCWHKNPKVTIRLNSCSRWHLKSLWTKSPLRSVFPTPLRRTRALTP